MASQSTPLVVLHGWGQSSAEWEGFRGRFHSRPVILFDLPGFGREPLVSEKWGVPEYADWVEAKLRGQGITAAHLLGHSFSGRIAALIASKRPTWLASLTLYGAPVLYRPSASIRVRSSLAHLLKPLLGSLRKGNTELTDADARGLGEVFRRVVPFDQTRTLPQIAVPTKLIWGEHDAAVPLSIAREAEKLIPGSALTIIPKAGHNAHIEQPDLFYGLATHFLTHVERSPAI